MLWIPFTLLAAFMQAWRNAFQKQLSKEVSIAGVTLARFLWASPLAAIYLFSLYQWQPVAWPEFSLPFSGFIIAAALAQILATALMVKLFKLRNYAIGAGLAGVVRGQRLGGLANAHPPDGVDGVEQLLGAAADNAGLFVGRHRRLLEGGV